MGDTLGTLGLKWSLLQSTIFNSALSGSFVLIGNNPTPLEESLKFIQFGGSRLPSMCETRFWVGGNGSHAPEMCRDCNNPT